MKEFNFEGTLDIYSDDPQIFQPTALKTIKDEFYNSLKDYNIYIIAKTNKIYFHPEDMYIDKRRGISYCYIAIKEEQGRCFTPLISRIPDEAYKIEVAPYPHKEIYLLDKNGTIIRSISTLQIISLLNEEIKLSFEVLYVGKSFGNKNKLNIINRLFDQNHKTLKKIINNTEKSEPDKEIYILGYNFIHEKRLIGTNHNWIDTPFTKERERIIYFKDLKISRKYKIDLIEEALINYFAPRYNRLLKNSLNRLKSSSVKAFQQLDITGIVVEFATKETGIKLFSDLVSPRKIHLVSFALQKEKDRVNFFNEQTMQSSREQNFDYLLNYS